MRRDVWPISKEQTKEILDTIRAGTGQTREEILKERSPLLMGTHWPFIEKMVADHRQRYIIFGIVVGPYAWTFTLILNLIVIFPMSPFLA